uniref:ABC transporter permease n=1 Tax=Agathobacter sp. TaxID=2021311 RepID=UPI004057603C
MSINKVYAILKKQIKETLKNKSILIQFIMFPLLTIIISNSVTIDDLPANFFVNLFGIMYIGMAPLVSISTIISEEKECNTLRVLLMSNVKASEYLVGVSFYVIVLCTIGTLLIGIQGNLRGEKLLLFMSFMFAGIIISTLIGAMVGICSKNQMSATSISVPLMMVFSFVPMLSMFNEKIKSVADFLYTQQISNFINNSVEMTIQTKDIVIIALNVLVALILFIILYRKKGLEN